MSKIKDSEQMLRFLNDLSKFSQNFSAYQSDPKKNENEEHKKDKKCNEEKEDKKNPQSPTEGIADEFIQQILDGYFNKK